MFRTSRKNLAGLSLFVLIFLTPLSARAADSYDIDVAHSNISFSVQHLMVSTTRGDFSDYTGTILFDKDNPINSQFDITIKVASIDTRNQQRDEHLRTAEFFDVEKYPAITFNSTKIEGSASNYTLTGQLTMHGVTKEINIPATIAGPIKSPFGDEAIGITCEFTVNRQDYGVSWNKQLDAGGVVVGDDVKVTVSIEAHRKPPEAKPETK